MVSGLANQMFHFNQHHQKNSLASATVMAQLEEIERKALK
jgi:hypothetical protein